jgi:hypothetical protein
MRGGGREWTMLADARAVLRNKWRKGDLLREAVDPRGLFPLRVTLLGPETSELSARFAEVREWVREYTDAEGTVPLRIEWREANNRVLGQNRIPAALLFDDLPATARFLGLTGELSRFNRIAGGLIDAFPALRSWVAGHCGACLDLEPAIKRLTAVTRWIVGHPRPGIYLRQLCVPGVDTKFIEKHRATLADWLDLLHDPSHIDPAFKGLKGFERRFGFLTKPAQVRFRALDPAAALCGFTDVTVRADEFIARPPRVKTVFVTENDINGLSFPPVQDAIVLFGRGYGFDHLMGADWLRERDIFYWGDIDTHGFAILGQFRGIFPQTRSLLMGRDTLLACRESWSAEAEPSMAAPPNLDGEEAALLHDLQTGLYGKSVRLEQELIPFDLVEETLRRIMRKEV